jgi:hypothetical protein
MEKPTKRKAFNFLRSYFDVVNELQSDEDKLSFLMSIINKQFLDEDPKELSFLVKLCYSSQKHAIESSVKGWKRVSLTDMQGNPLSNPPIDPPTNPPTDLPTNPKEVEEEEEVKEEEEEELPLPLENDFDLFWKKYNKKIDSTKCKVKFNKLSKIKIETILKVVDSYVAATVDVQYRKNPLTWLNGECWKDVEVNTFLPTKDKPFGKSNQL